MTNWMQDSDAKLILRYRYIDLYSNGALSIVKSTEILIKW